MKIHLKASFSKKEMIRYISHLDVLRLFMRGVRRAQLPVKLKEGFNKHPIVRIERAVKLGQEFDGEDVYFRLDQYVDPAVFCDLLNMQLPSGIQIYDAKIVCV